MTTTTDPTKTGIVGAPFTFAGGTVVADSPPLQVTETWNNVAVTFTGYRVNITDTASAAGSLLMDLQVAGSSKFSVAKSGAFAAPGLFWVETQAGSSLYGSNAVWRLNGSSDGYVVTRGDGRSIAYNVGGLSLRMSSTGLAAWYNGGDHYSATIDTAFARKAAKVIEINNGTAGTYAGCAITTGTQTVAQLTAAATAGAGARASVSDATVAFTSANVSTIVAGGGANIVPVWCDGTNWRIG